MPRKKKSEKAIDAAFKAGAQYIQDQVSGDYFRDWVWDQMVEAEEMRKADPNSVIPLETKRDYNVLARNMLQQLGWDIDKDLEHHTVLSLIEDDSEESVRAFWDGLHEELRSSSMREWIADELIIPFHEDIKEQDQRPPPPPPEQMSLPGVRSAGPQHGRPDPNPLSGARKDARDEAIRRAVDSARRHNVDYVVWMDSHGNFQVDPASSASWDETIAVARAGNGHLSYKPYRRSSRVAESRRVSPEAVRRRIPADFPVQPLRPGQNVPDRCIATCGTCGLSWNDCTSTSMTPTPAGRCPFEAFHSPSPRQHRAKEHVVRDFIAVDPTGKPISSPSQNYFHTKKQADKVGGYVKYHHVPNRPPPGMNDDPRDLGYDPDSKAGPRNFPKLHRVNPPRHRAGRPRRHRHRR